MDLPKALVDSPLTPHIKPQTSERIARREIDAMPLEEPVNILAHMSKEECDFLDTLQQGMVIDPETNLRDYTMLPYIFREFPEMKEMVDKLIMEEGELKAFAEGGEVEPGRPIAPELEEMREAGTGNDTELVIITPELAETLEEWSRGKGKTNPITGFREYGFFKELIRIAAPVLGAVFGGPVGAFAAGTLAGKATGQPWGSALKAGAVGAGGAMLAPAIGGAMGVSLPGGLGGGASMLGNAIPAVGGFNNMLNGGVSSLLGGLGMGGASMGSGAAAVPLSSAGTMLPAAGATTAAGAVAPGTGLLGGLGKLVSGLGPAALPLGAAAFMGLKGAKADQKALDQYERNKKGEYDAWRGVNHQQTYSPTIVPLQETNDRPLTPEEKAGYKEPLYFNQYQQGGPVRGRGTGQSDQIPRNIPENSYIIDASTVSDIGDGSTNAGFDKLNNLMHRIPEHLQNRKNGGVIKALLSDGEYEIPPEKVAGLGNGSSDNGAKVLESLVIQIRNKKRSSGKKLPPKMKNFGGYLSSLTQ